MTTNGNNGYKDFTEEERKAFRAGVTHGYLTAVSDKLTRGKKIGKGLLKTLSDAEDLGRKRATQLVNEMDELIKEGMAAVGYKR